MAGNEFNKAFQLLAEILEKSGKAPQWLIVCGGSALQAQGLIDRATKDVDIFASRDELEGIQLAYPLPDHLKEAIRQVAEIYTLPENWLNASAALTQLPFENYPSYFFEDHLTQDFGSHLKISYLSVKGLITLKVLATLQRDAPRDLEDLIAIQPKASDLVDALNWFLSLPQTGDPQQSKIIHLFKTLNHEPLITQFFPSER